MRIEKRSDLARLVKLRRQAQGRTQKDVAEAVGITRQSLARIEQGDGGTSFDTVLRVLSELETSLEAQLGSQSSPGPVQRALGQGTDTSVLVERLSQNVDLSAISRALNAGIQTIGRSALTPSSTKHLATAAIINALNAGIRSVDSDATREIRPSADSPRPARSEKPSHDPYVPQERKPDDSAFARLKRATIDGDPDLNGSPIPPNRATDE